MSGATLSVPPANSSSDRRGCPTLRVLCEGWEPRVRFQLGGPTLLRGAGPPFPSTSLSLRGGWPTPLPRLPHPCGFCKGGIEGGWPTPFPRLPHPSRLVRRVGTTGAFSTRGLTLPRLPHPCGSCKDGIEAGGSRDQASSRREPCQSRKPTHSHRT